MTPFRSPHGETSAGSPEFFDGRSFASADEVIDFVVDRLNMVPPSDTLRTALREYLAGAGEPFVWNADSFDSRVASSFLLMSSPEYQIQ